ncbi:SRPBCC family protein [Niabella insulamsoli]|uniref:SRPBCC family protein n=1 Tax=Niabella insulamsoli TaxID=3144874 RepID=UPI0031FD526B
MNIRITAASGIYMLRAEQELHCDIETAWQYFSTPRNLQTLTPDNLGFEITSGDEGEIYAGKIITYDLSILPLIKTKWVTEITQVADKRYFIDEQRKGPYALWHHEHHFSATESGVLMKDYVSYKLPLGGPGRWVAGKLIANRLKEIFSFRYKELERIFA